MLLYSASKSQNCTVVYCTIVVFLVPKTALISTHVNFKFTNTQHIHNTCWNVCDVVCCTRFNSETYVLWLSNEKQNEKTIRKKKRNEKYKAKNVVLFVYVRISGFGLLDENQRFLQISEFGLDFDLDTVRSFVSGEMYHRGISGFRQIFEKSVCSNVNFMK